MGALISDADIAELQSVYPLAKVRPYTGQQEQFLLYYLRGMSVAAASRQAGYKDTQAARLILQQPRTTVVLDYLRERLMEDTKVTREMLTAMLFDAHSKAESATEEVLCIRELGKMHEIYPDAKRNLVEMNTKGDVTNVKQIRRMTDEELLALAGNKAGLSPESDTPKLVEGEVIEHGG